MKMFFAANNIYFVKNKYFPFEKKIFFRLSFATIEQPYWYTYYYQKILFGHIFGYLQ